VIPVGMSPHELGLRSAVGHERGQGREVPSGGEGVKVVIQ